MHVPRLNPEIMRARVSRRWRGHPPVEYQVNLEYALVWSKNVPSVQLFKLVGAKDVEAWARRLEITTPIITDQALALGASCTRIDELTRAFSAFARNGSLEEPVYLRRVRDRAGHIVEDNTAVSDPWGRPMRAWIAWWPWLVGR